MKYEDLLNDMSVVEELDHAGSEEEFRAILSAKGLPEDEIQRFMRYLGSIPAELTEDDLTAVAGGGNPILQRYMCKWAYRVQHGKWFVKTSYNEDTHTITATNRFGKKVSEDYIY